MTSEVIERKRLWLSWLELPWDSVRDDLIEEMHRVGMSQLDLAFELRSAGYRASQNTVGRWLGSEGVRGVRPPTMDALQALVQVFARVSVGEWAKGRLLSPDGPAEAVGLVLGAAALSPHDANRTTLGAESQERDPDAFSPEEVGALITRGFWA